MTSSNTDTCDSKVVESTDWLDLNKYRVLESGRGVYLLSNFFFQVKFVGRLVEGDLITEISNTIKSGKSNGATKIKVLYTRSEIQAISLERKLIKKYNPINNVK